MKRTLFAGTVALLLSGAAAFAAPSDMQVAQSPATTQAAPDTIAQAGGYVQPGYDGSSRETYYQENMGENPVRSGNALGLFPPSDGNG
jgi:opacity protein-like surface antigen